MNGTADLHIKLPLRIRVRIRVRIRECREEVVTIEDGDKRVLGVMTGNVHDRPCVSDLAKAMVQSYNLYCVMKKRWDKCDENDLLE